MICPICNTEYRKGVRLCKLCGVQLHDQVRHFVEAGYVCRHCGAELAAVDQFCPRCGYLRNVNFVTSCQNHRDREAIGICVLCRKELCKDCASKRNARLLCEEHYDVDIIEEWAAVLESTDSMEINFAREVLESERILSHPFDKGSSHLFVPIVTDSILSRWNEEGRVRVQVFVPMMEFRRAIEVLQDHNLLFLYECGRCGHRFNEDSQFRCPKCREEFA